MPLFFIHVRNSRFASRDDGARYEQPENALVVGIRSALAILSDEIDSGLPSAAVEVSVVREDGTPLLCSAVTMSVSPLIPARAEPA